MGRLVLVAAAAVVLAAGCGTDDRTVVTAGESHARRPVVGGGAGLASPLDGPERAFIAGWRPPPPPPPVVSKPAERRRSPRPVSRASRSRTPSGGGVLSCIRAGESGGNYRAVSPSGKYRGGYQFDAQTWRAMGGSGDPAAASPAEQDARAAELYRQRGTQPWPNRGRCG